MLELATRVDFEAVYALMQTAFPPDERRPREGQSALLDEPAYRLYVAKQAGEVSAFLAVWRLDDICFLEHFAVAPVLRGQGLGATLLAELRTLEAGMLCLEAEPPETPLAVRRIAFYTRCGLCTNPYFYLQPPLAQGQAALPLVLMTEQVLAPATFTRVRACIYREVYHVEPNAFDGMEKQ